MDRMDRIKKEEENIEHRTSNAESSSFIVCRHRSSFIVHHSSFSSEGV